MASTPIALTDEEPATTVVNQWRAFRSEQVEELQRILETMEQLMASRRPQGVMRSVTTVRLHED